MPAKSDCGLGNADCGLCEGERGGLCEGERGGLCEGERGGLSSVFRINTEFAEDTESTEGEIDD